MSKLSKTISMLILAFLSTQVMADYVTDAAYLDQSINGISNVPVGSSSAITTELAILGQYAPLKACIDTTAATGENLSAAGDPSTGATLNCGGGTGGPGPSTTTSSSGGSTNTGQGTNLLTQPSTWGN
jgi:hypothetical protein